MGERDDLLENVAKTISDYRVGELTSPTPEHVDRWVRQFGKDAQVPLLREVAHVLGQTYFSKQGITKFLSGETTNAALVGNNPSAFWRSANFLDVQQDGSSQKDMLKFFDAALYKEFGFRIGECGSQGGPFIYIDDAIFSGNRVGNDLCDWMSFGSAPAQAVVHVLVLATHTLGEWQLKERLKKHANEVGKNITFGVWRLVSLENRKAYADTSEVLWPAVLPANAALQAYVASEQRFPFKARQSGGKLKINVFSSEASRQLLESELLLAGIKILSSCQNASRIMRPLGYSAFGLGFGATIATYRNCPNNCPLALWWGDPTAPAYNPLSKWYPLMPRKTYAQH